jgi:hypothetical protein
MKLQYVIITLWGEIPSGSEHVYIWLEKIYTVRYVLFSMSEANTTILEVIQHEISPAPVSGAFFLLFYVSNDSIQMKSGTEIYIQLSLVELCKLYFVTTKLHNSKD